MELPTYITVEEAARRYRIPEDTLTKMVEDGKIRAVKVNGGVAVAVEAVTMLAVKSEEGDELVSIREASRRLNVPPGVISRWHKYGWLSVRGSGPNRMILISMCQAEKLAALREQQGKRGRRLIPKDCGLTV